MVRVETVAERSRRCDHPLFDTGTVGQRFAIWLPGPQVTKNTRDFSGDSLASSINAAGSNNNNNMFFGDFKVAAPEFGVPAGQGGETATVMSQHIIRESLYILLI